MIVDGILEAKRGKYIKHEVGGGGGEINAGEKIAESGQIRTEN